MHRFLVFVSCVFSLANAGYQHMVPVHPDFPIVPDHPDYPDYPVHPVVPVNPNPPSGVLSRCDPNVIAAIERYWRANGMPQSLIQTAVINKKEVVVETTDGYYSDQVGCVYSYFTGITANSASVLIRYIFKYSDGFEDKTFQVVESKGSSYDPASMVRRYHVFYESGVTGIYSCLDTPNAPLGSPAGFIKISEHRFEFPTTTHIVEKARHVLKSVGVNLQTFYGWSCPKNGLVW